MSVIRNLPLLAAVLALLTLAPGAGAATPPAAFYGVNWDGEIAREAPAAIQDEQWTRMARIGTGSARTAFLWSQAQRQANGPIDFSHTDRVVAQAASNGIELLPTVIAAPQWARRGRGAFAPPREVRTYTAYLTAVVKRYGNTGTFWTERPDLPRRPVRAWQVWNEPHLQYQWTIDDEPGADYARDYGTLLRASYRAVKRADPRAKVVLAGLANRSWEYLEELYRRGKVHRSYDVAAIHPYTSRPEGVIELVQRFRRVMRRHRDSRRELWITELGLPASKGQTRADNQRLQTTDAGMARFLTKTYALVARKRRARSVGVGRVYWYTWASSYCCNSFRYTGLVQYPSRDGVHEMPAYDAFRRTAQAAAKRRGR